MSEEQQEASNPDSPTARKRPRRRRRGGGGGGGGEPQQGVVKEGGAEPRPQQPKQPKPQQSKQQPKQRVRDERPAEQPYKLKTPADKFGGREPVSLRVVEESFEETPLRPVNAFELFCAYHLCITDDNQYRRQSPRDVARRFGLSPEELHEALQRFGLDMPSINQCGYDMDLALLDIRVAPEGIDRRELAKGLFEELLELNPQVRQACQD